MYALAKWASFYLVYSGVGVLLFTLSIRPVEHWLRRSGRKPVLLAPPFFFLVSLGVYMGLIVRLNSWEVVSHPLLVWNTVQAALVNSRLLVPMGVFAGVLWVLYELADIWIDRVVSLASGAGRR